ncbi:hemagglutinin/protease [Plakobranchus ocellatus]|uniref:Hemagglutinin/protease n=1 Tax=Plakobranchus ocellatus TaxID=259542 RepID=A0AAV4DZ90_9GAST|nr:hemagglutinin/protease [Plakobranchus ocellatus]
MRLHTLSFIGSCSPYAYGLGGNPKTGRREYGSSGLCLPVPNPVFGRCRMESDYCKVVDNQRSTDSNRQTVISFTCNNGYSDGRNGAYGVASDAFFYGHLTGRFHQEKYNFRALSWTPRMVVHYGSCYDNAFWDGRDMYFGDGCSTFYPLVSQDVIAHELAHGITSTNSNLVYR